MLLAIDVGTSSTRACLVGTDGSIGPLASTSSIGTGGTLDPDRVWADCLGVAAKVVGDSRGPVDAVGITAQLGLVAVDESGRPTTRAITWSDRRASAEAREIAARCPSAEDLGGRRPSGELVGPKLRWLARHRPEALAQARWVLSLKDYLILCLTGEVVTDETHASYTLLFDIRRRAWSEELIEAVEMDLDRLPPVLSASQPAGTLRTEVARKLGVATGIPVAVGGPDGTMGALGAGAVTAGITVDVAGSTDVLLQTVDLPPIPSAVRAQVTAFALPGLWTVGGPTATTGLALTWLARLLGFGSSAELLAEHGEGAARVSPGSEGLVFDPTLSGPRFPYDASPWGLVAGVTLDHGPAHFLRALEEGIVFTVRDGLEVLAATGRPLSEVRLVGGAPERWTATLRSDAWDRRVRIMGGREATMLGAAMLAGMASGVFASAREAADALVGPGTVIEPRPSHIAPLARAFLRWRRVRLAVARAEDSGSEP